MPKTIKPKEAVLSPIQSSYVEYQYNARKANMQPIATLQNVVIFLVANEKYANKFRYNKFHQQVEFDGDKLTDEHLNMIAYDVEKDSGMVKVEFGLIARAVAFIASNAQYDPFIDYLNSTEWDKVPRLKELIPKSFNLEPSVYYEAIGYNWMLALAYRQLRPGYQFDYMITLVGQRQGMGKTSFFKTLVAGFDESAVKILKTDFENKDNLKKMSAGAVFVNIDEGAALGKKAQQSIKTFITETEDEYRDPFAREMKIHKRRFVFGMTENDMNPFGDATGGRRYWPVEVMTRVNFKWIEEHRDQLFAEAWYRARRGEPMLEIPREITDEIQELHRSQDIWEEKVVAFLITQKEFSEGKEEYVTKPSTILADGFGMDIEKVDQRQERRLTNCMKAIGFVPTTRRVDGRSIRVWLLPTSARDRIIRNLSNTELETLRKAAGTIDQQFNQF